MTVELCVSVDPLFAVREVIAVVDPTAPLKPMVPAPNVVTDKVRVLVVASASIVALKVTPKPDEGLIETLVAVDVGELFNTTGRVVGKERLLFVVAIVMVFCSWICPVPAEKVKVPMEIEPFIMVIPVVVFVKVATLLVAAPVMGPTVIVPVPALAMNVEAEGTCIVPVIKVKALLFDVNVVVPELNWKLVPAV